MKSATHPHLLLINPWIYDFSAFDLWSKPLGLLYVGGYLQQLGYRLSLIDCMDRLQAGLPPHRSKKYGVGHFLSEPVEKPAALDYMPRRYYRFGMPEELFISKLKALPAPDAVLLTSLMTYWYPGPRRVIELVRKIHPGVPVILGGIYATLMPEHARKHLQPDFLLRGQGELQAAGLLAEILPGGRKNTVPPKNLDNFPPPAWELYPKLEYLTVMSSRGCPYRCTFCATHQISGGFAQRNPAKVAEEILTLSRRHRVRDIAFYDDALLLNKRRRLIPLLKKICDTTSVLRFHTPNGLHAREIDEEVAGLFFRSGFKTIRLSFESVNPERAADMKNKVTPGDLEQAVTCLTTAGYPRKSLEAYVLMGLPGQTFEEIYESILFVNSLGIKVSLASFSPIPGTVDYRRTVQAGLFPPDADPLLMNNSVYPLYRSGEIYRKFHAVRQFVQMLNEGINRGVNLLQAAELKSALKKLLSLKEKR